MHFIKLLAFFLKKDYKDSEEKIFNNKKINFCNDVEIEELELDIFNLVLSNY